MKNYTADFETCVWCENETWVWAWAICEIGNEENIVIDNNIESFINFCETSKNSVFYFHNLKFDGEFIISFLLKNGFKHIEDKKDKETKTFTTLISDMGQFYQIEVYFEVGNKKVKKVTFIDSLKIIPFSVREIAKAFGLTISKLEIDYKKPRFRGWRLTEEEKDYIKNDVLIVAKALHILFEEKLDRMTQGSNALHDFKNILGKRKFEHYFPKLDFEIDKDIRKAYKGGFTYLNPIYKEKEVKRGVVLDVNSLYPSVMFEKELPFGEPIFFEGKYKEDKVYNLYIQHITCCFRLKENKIPMIQIKNSSYFIGNEYLTSSDDQIVSLTLTSVDLKLFLENYEVTELEFINGWKFKSIDFIFKEYIDKWIKRKNKATIEKNKGQRTLAKLMLNALYGKFATSLIVRSKIPYLDEEGIVKYKLSEETTKDGIYIPIACFITAYAREKTIRTSQAIKEYSLKKYGIDLYYYSDTDSIHTGLSEEELKKFCDIDDIKLGAWKCEGKFVKAKFIRQKCYLEAFYKEKIYKGKINKLKCRKKITIKGFNNFLEIKITCAGMPSSCYNFVTWKNFKTGFSCGGKLTFKHVLGGVKLVETDFTIKEEKMKKEIIKF